MSRFLTEDDRETFIIFLRWLHRNYGVTRYYQLTSDDNNMLSISSEVCDWMVENGFAKETHGEHGQHYLDMSGDMLLTAVEQEQYDSHVGDGVLLGKPTGIELLDEIINTSDTIFNAIEIVCLRGMYKLMAGATEEEIYDIVLASASNNDMFTAISQLARSIITSRQEGI